MFCLLPFVNYDNSLLNQNESQKSEQIAFTYKRKKIAALALVLHLSYSTAFGTINIKQI